MSRTTDNAAAAPAAPATPWTDDITNNGPKELRCIVPADFARSLERLAHQQHEALRNLASCVKRDRGGGGILLPTEAALLSAQDKLAAYAALEKEIERG